MPIPRADPLGVRVLVGIDDPAEGATLRSPVRVSGEAAVFEATLLWEVRRDGAVVRSGFTSTAEGQRFAPYAFSLDLPPGDYEIQRGGGRPVGRRGAPGHDRLPPRHGCLLILPERRPSAFSSTAASAATVSGSPPRHAAPGSGVTASSRRVGRRVRACSASRSGSAPRAAVRTRRPAPTAPAA